MRSSRSLGGICARPAAPPNWAAPTTRASQRMLRVTVRPTAKEEWDDITTCRIGRRGSCGSARHAQHRLDRRSLRRLPRCSIDLRKGIERHHAIDRHFALHEEVDQLGDELLRMAFPLDYAAYHAAKLQERHL